MAYDNTKPTPEMNEILVQSGSGNREQALAAQHELAVALQSPLRMGVMSGDITGDIFERVNLAPGTSSEFPLDFLSPGTEKDFVAYTIPNHGRIPERNVEGDYVMVPTYDVGASIDWLLKYARDARWDVVGRAMDVLQGQFVKKMNDDGWHTLVSAGADRNVMIYDADATAGQFSKRLVSLLKVIMRRNGGGNSSSINRGELTDLYISPEGIEDIRNWGVDEVDPVTRRELIVSDGGLMTRIFNVNLHTLDELGVSQEYQNFYTQDLSGSLPSDKTEIVVGLDLRNRDSFVMPVRAPVEVFEDDTLHRQRRAGLYGWAEHGFAALDTRRVLLGAF